MDFNKIGKKKSRRMEYMGDLNDLYASYGRKIKWKNRKNFCEVELKFPLEHYGSSQQRLNSTKLLKEEELFYQGEYDEVIGGSVEEEEEDYFDSIRFVLTFKVPKNFPKGKKMLNSFAITKFSELSDSHKEDAKEFTKFCNYERKNNCRSVKVFVEKLNEKMRNIVNEGETREDTEKPSPILEKFQTDLASMIKVEETREFDRKKKKTLQLRQLKDEQNDEMKKLKEKEWIYKEKQSLLNKVSANESLVDSQIKKRVDALGIDVSRSMMERIVEENKCRKKLQSESFMDGIDYELQIKKFNSMHFEKMSIFSDENEQLMDVDLYLPNVSDLNKKFREILKEKISRKKKKKEYNVHCDFEEIFKEVKNHVVRFTKKKMDSEGMQSIFRRRNSLICSGEKTTLFLFGGYDEDNTILNDFIRVNIDLGTVDVFRDLHNSDIFFDGRNFIPYFKDTKMLFYNNYVVFIGRDIPRQRGRRKKKKKEPFMDILGNDGYMSLYPNQRDDDGKKGLAFFVISNPMTSKIGAGANLGGTGLNPHHPSFTSNWGGSDRQIPLLFNFSAISCFSTKKPSIIIFGGFEYGKGLSNLLYCVRLLHSSYYEIEKDVYSQTSADMVWPSPRHSAIIVEKQGTIVLYGGVGKREEVLRDCFIWNISTRIWKEVELDFIPPKLSNYSFVKTKDGFLMFGGVNMALTLRDGIKKDSTKFIRSLSINDDIFSFSCSGKKFSVVKMMKEFHMGGGNVKGNGKYVYSKFSTNACSYGKNNGAFVGGVFNNFVKGWNDPIVGNDIFLLHNKNDIGLPNLPLMEYLMACRKNKVLTDVVFLIKEKEEKTEISLVPDNLIDELTFDEEEVTTEVRAHFVILQARCEDLAKAIVDNVKKSQDGCYYVEFGEKYLSYSVMKNFINFLYSGTLKIDRKEDMMGLLQFSQKYSPDKIYPFLKKICSKKMNRSLRNCGVFYDRFVKDMQSIFSGGKFSEVAIRYSDGTQVQRHKLFLYRSKYFKSMLTSNFKESIENSIDFSKLNKLAVEIIMRYFYTDIIAIDSRTAISVLIYSLQFELKIVSTHCRKFVKECLSSGVVVQLMNVATLYKDVILQSICRNFILENYEMVSKEENYSSINVRDREKISKLFEKRKKREEKKEKKKKKRKKEDQ